MSSLHSPFHFKSIGNYTKCYSYLLPSLLLRVLKNGQQLIANFQGTFIQIKCYLSCSQQESKSRVIITQHLLSLIIPTLLLIIIYKINFAHIKPNKLSVDL